MKLTDMRALLERSGLRLTKSLGQNFLHDGNQLRRIVQAAGLSSADPVLEIGPGLGPLTELLCATAGRVLAIEMDRRLVELLHQRLARWSNFELLCADALAWLRAAPRDLADWVVVSNLPYSVGSPLLVELARGPRPPRRMVVTLQAEVVGRVSAAAGSAEYGVLTLLVQQRYVPRDRFRIPASCFFPEPEVESACMTLELRHDAAGAVPPADPAFERVVKRAFSQRRKMMLKLLRQDWDAGLLNRAYAELGLDPAVRAEQVSREQFEKLTRCLAEADAGT